MYTYIYYTIYIYYIYIHRYILAYIQPAPRYSRICYTRTNRYDCVSLGSLVPPSLFFSYLYIYIYIYRIHVPYLFLVLPFRSSFSKVPSLFFHPYPSFVLVIEAIFQLAGLTRTDLLSARQREREREFSRNGLQDHRATLRKGTRTGRIGAGRCDGIDGRVAPTSRAVKLNAYLRGSNEN